MTDEQKLLILADWLDLQFPNDPNPEVQVDLRRISAAINQLRKVVDAAIPHLEAYVEGLAYFPDRAAKVMALVEAIRELDETDK